MRKSRGHRQCGAPRLQGDNGICFDEGGDTNFHHDSRGKSDYAELRNELTLWQGYSFSVTKLNALLLTLFERYANLLRGRFSHDFQKASLSFHALICY